MGRELIEAFDRADADDAVRAVIVTGAGRGFCAGADLAGGGETFDYRAREREGEVPRDGGGRFVLRVFDCTKPVIAAINGPAVGVGATMTLPMDIRLAADDARMGFVFARRGIVPEACSSWFLPRLVGISQAMEWVATGRVFDAAGGACRRARALAAPRRRAARRRAGAGSRDRRDHRPGLRGARPPADVADARRRASDDRPPRRLPGDVRPRPVGRRSRGDRRLPGEARRGLSRPGQRRPSRRVREAGSRRSSASAAVQPDRCHGPDRPRPRPPRWRPGRRRSRRHWAAAPAGTSTRSPAARAPRRRPRSSIRF